MSDFWLKISRYLTFFILLIMLVGVYKDNTIILLACAIMIIALNCLLIIYTELKIRDNKNKFEQSFKAIIQAIDECNKEQEEQAKKPKIKIN